MDEAAGAGGPRPSSRLLVFRVGDRVLAVPVAAGTRVLDVERYTPVPTAPTHLLGLTNVEGAVVPVVDVRPSLGLARRPWALPLRAHVIGGVGEPVAVAVDEILGLEPGTEESPPGRSGDLDRSLVPLCRGECRVGSQRVAVLDPQRLVDELRVAAPDSTGGGPAGRTIRSGERP